MWTIMFQIVVAIVIIILTYTSIIHKLLIARLISDKLYKNFGLALLGFAVYVNITASMLMGMESSTTLSIVNSGKRPMAEVNDLFYSLTHTLNLQTGYLLAAIVFYLLTILLYRSILKDIEIDTNKPKYRWGSIN